MTIEEMRKKRAKALADAKAISDAAIADGRVIDGNADMTPEEGAEFDALMATAEQLAGEIANMESAQARGADLQAGLDALNAPAARVSAPEIGNFAESRIGEQSEPLTVVPASVARYSSIRSFSGSDAEMKAFKFGMWVLAANGNHNAQSFCARNGVGVQLATINDQGELIAHTGGTNTAGGYLVPGEFDSDMAILREKYG